MGINITYYTRHYCGSDSILVKEMKKKILIIEDEVQLARTLQEKIEKEGFTTEIASDGKEGLHVLENGSFDLVILDLLMPQMDGFQFLNEYTEKYPPIIVLSNLSDEQELERALGSGAKRYMIKASTPLKEVVKTIKEVLEN